MKRIWNYRLNYLAALLSEFHDPKNLLQLNYFVRATSKKTNKQTNKMRQRNNCRRGSRCPKLAEFIFSNISNTRDSVP